MTDTVVGLRPIVDVHAHNFVRKSSFKWLPGFTKNTSIIWLGKPYVTESNCESCRPNKEVYSLNT